MNTLVLDIGMLPINITPWKRALKLCLLGKANLIESRMDRQVRSENITLFIPSIIQILNIDFFHRLNYVNIIPFNRRNVYYRDNGRCMYCNKKVSLNNFTFDHVLPKSMGGKTNWKNIVVCCPKCNRKKKNRTPKHAGMKLVRHPTTPRLNKKVASSIVKKIGLEKLEEESWKGYWDVKLID
jgi:5-methylcytosine-specific restriction endonuclease McrA